MARALRVRLIPRLLAVVCVAALLPAVLAAWVGWPVAALAGITVSGLVLALLIGRLPDMLDALVDALGSLRERDYAVRIDEKRSGVFAPIAAQLNALGASLRAERNDVYQKELLLET